MTTPLLTVPQAADLAQVHVSTINRALAAGQLTRVKIGNATRVLAHELLHQPAPTIDSIGGKGGGQ